MMNRSYHILLPVILFFFSCDRESDFPYPGPQLEVDYQGNPTIIQEPGNEVLMEFFLQASAGLQEFSVRIGSEEVERLNFMDEFSSRYSFRFEIPSSAENGDVFPLVFELEDRQQRSSTLAYEVLVQSTFEETIQQIGGKEVTRLKGRLNRDYEMVSETLYLIDSTFSIESNSTLRIAAGTEVYFKVYPEETLLSRLVITRGSKIEARGTPEHPIVFSSEQVLLGQIPTPADWGGIFIYGNAPSNQGVNILDEGFRYGGNQVGENSGVLRYARIEYAGKNGNHGLHLFGVGSGTTLDHIQVYDNENIAFRIKGGNVSLKWIAAIRHGGYGIWAEHGWQGRGQFWIFQTDRRATLVPINFWNQARSIEMRNDESFFLNTPRTTFQITNVTSIGNGFESVQASGTRRGIRIRRGATGILQNSITAFFPDEGIRVEDLDLSELGQSMQLGNARSFGNRINYAQEAESFFEQNSSYGVNQNAVAGISLSSFVGSVPSSFNPATLGNFFSSAPYIGAVESAENDWTSEGNWFKNLDGTIR
ncbi:hypothetical protein [Algoriphagus confluentis]|uniref:Right-handed parallel beta-helix repeat-containing protein n=1 Tax=Algoriphagus confluentis TaxID=1697556 RepID=A0ABQ6PIX2_9BACT|nr:hypothetical protein Aconfl_05210 [Algoriphagus confluentis]